MSGKRSDERDSEGSGREGSAPGDGERPWNDPDGELPWNDPGGETGRGDGRTDDRVVEHDLAGDPTVQSIASQYRRIWWGVDGALVVALGIAALVAFRVGGTLAASGLALVVLLTYRYLPTLRSAGRIVLTTPRSPAATRDAVTDHRSPLLAVNAVAADRIERTGEDETTIVTGEERLVYHADREGDGVDFELRRGGDPIARGTAHVEAREGGSRVEFEYERLERFRLRDLLHLPILEWYQRKLWGQLDYEVAVDEDGLTI